MAKRRTNQNGDGEGSSKRVRIASSDDEAQIIPNPRTSKSKGKAKATQNEDDSDYGEGGVPEQPGNAPEDDEKFEAENQETVRAAIEAKRMIHGVCTFH
jgi:hypothetical protein